MNAAANSSSSHRYSIQKRDSHTAWDHVGSCVGWDVQFEQLTPVSFQGHVTEAWLGPVQVFYEEVNSPLSYRGAPWKGSRIFFSSLEETGAVYYNNRLLPGNTLITHPGDAFERISCNGSYKVVFIVLDESFFQRYTQRVVGDRIFDDTQETMLFNSNSSVVSSFQRNVLQVLEDLTTAPKALSSEHARRELQDRVLGMLIEPFDDSRASSTQLPYPTTRAYIVDKAMQFMESRLADPISLSDICEVVRISPRTLRYSFEEVLGVSPTRYLLVRRLNQVRQELSACSNHHVMIEEVAVRWGFWHMGRFARFYRQSFGERPSDTRRRAQVCA